MVNKMTSNCTRIIFVDDYFVLVRFMNDTGICNDIYTYIWVTACPEIMEKKLISKLFPSKRADCSFALIAHGA